MTRSIVPGCSIDDSRNNHDPPLIGLLPKSPVDANTMGLVSPRITVSSIWSARWVSGGLYLVALADYQDILACFGSINLPLDPVDKRQISMEMTCSRFIAALVFGLPFWHLAYRCCLGVRIVLLFVSRALINEIRTFGSKDFPQAQP